MKRIHKLIQLVFTFALIVSFSLPGTQPAAARAGGVRTQRNAQTGKVSHVGAAAGRPIQVPGADAPGMDQRARALAMIRPYAVDFGLRQAERELKLEKAETAPGRQVTKFQQTYNDIPVLAGELIVNASDSGSLLSIDGEIAPDLALDTQPQLTAEQAAQAALEATAKSRRGDAAAYEASQPQLWIYDSRLLQPDGLPAALVWRTEVTSKGNNEPLRELVLVDAQRGSVRLMFNQVDEGVRGADRAAQAPAQGGLASKPAAQPQTVTANIRTYSMGHSMNDALLPGTLLCTLTSPSCGDADADHAEAYGLGTYTYYMDHFGRNSLDGAGMPIIMSVHYGNNWQNSQWNLGQAMFGDGWATDDIVGHELTHGVTEHASNLFYFYQSGAINESLSDIFGELYDQSNGLGNDTAGKKWLIGEDIPGFPNGFRSMSTPTSYFNPDKMTSPYYDWDPDELDNGGVHTNSGISNKAAALLVDSGSFNGHSIAALGADKTAAIYYEANTHLLTSGADYADLYADLPQACQNLVGRVGITPTDCDSVQNAVDATEMNLQPTPGNYNPEAAMCGAGLAPMDRFYDGFENGTANWTFSSGRWTWDSINGPYAHTGTHFLYADDLPQAVTDTSAAMKTGVLIPAGAYLHFAQAYDFEHTGGIWYDGGVLEYSANGGAWTDAGPLMEANGYRGSIAPSDGNPLHGRSAFVGTSNGYISTRLNLGALAGQTVKFRWRMGLDAFGFDWGWWLDDVRIYTCRGNDGVNVSIGGSAVGNYSIAPSASTRQSYAGVDNGPVQVYSADGSTPIVASERVAYSPDGGTSWSSFSEIMGLPSNQLTTSYVMPWYNNAELNTQVRFGNVGSVGTNVTVKIGGVVRGTYLLSPSQSLRVSYPGLNSGPVVISSSGNVPIIASQRVAYSPDGGATWPSFAELMALPSSKLTTSYVMPWYNNAELNTQIRFGNVGTTSTNVTVRIGGVVKGVYGLAPNQSLRVSYPGLNSGPVVISSSGGVKIIASQRVAYSPDGGATWPSFTELMGLPSGSLTNSYWLPLYDNVTHNDQLRFGNVGGASTTVTVKVAGVLRGMYTLAPSQSLRISYPGLNAGPVQVTSSVNVPIIVSHRVAYTPDGGTTWSHFAELMALPGNQLSTSYVMPWYNNADLNTQLRFAVP